MANYSAAFGYQVYIVPLLAAEVDTAFTGINTGIGTTNGFIDTTTLVASADSVSYASGVFTVDGTPFVMDGADFPAKLVGLTNAALETDTNTEEVVTYDDSTKGFSTSIATGKSWSVSLAGVADFKDAAYQIMRLTEQNTVADGLRVKFVRVGPTGSSETVYGYGTLTGYTEAVEAGSIVAWEATLTGYGPYRLDLDAA